MHACPLERILYLATAYLLLAHHDSLLPDVCVRKARGFRVQLAVLAVHCSAHCIKGGPPSCVQTNEQFNPRALSPGGLPLVLTRTGLQSESGPAPASESDRIDSKGRRYFGVAEQAPWTAWCGQLDRRVGSAEPTLQEPLNRRHSPSTRTTSMRGL